MRKPRINSRDLKDFRRDLRNHATSAEAFLWTHLKGKKLAGRKFRRQQSINRFIVDFYCPSEKLVIELDGAYHLEFSKSLKDKERDAYLTSAGFKVLRFENKQVFENLNGLLEEIKASFGEQVNQK